MNNWKPGMMARYVGLDSRFYGQVVEVTSFPMVWSANGREYVTTIPPLGSCLGTYANRLIPIPDEYDGNQVTTWSECPFKPLEVCDVDIS